MGKDVNFLARELVVWPYVEKSRSTKFDFRSSSEVIYAGFLCVKLADCINPGGNIPEIDSRATLHETPRWYLIGAAIELVDWL